MKKQECNHPVKYRQVIAGGIDDYSLSPYAILCLVCGKKLVQGDINSAKSFNKIGEQ